MALTYNPPPNWPGPPPGWRPAANWQPPQEWGPPPPGWSLWVEANPGPFRRTLIVLAVVCPLWIVLGALAFRVGDPEQLGRMVGSSLVCALIVLPLVGLLARSSGRRWPTWLYVVAVLIGLLGMRILVTLGQLS